MKNIYIVGFMGTGKTTTAKILADKLNGEFVEMDTLIEKGQNKTITEIFADSGEAHFRCLEKELLKEISTKSGLVVSCGGGLICNKDNLPLLKNSGIVISLKAKASTIYQRTKHNTNRPLLNIDNPLTAIKALLLKRKPYYDQADHLIATDELSPKEVVAEIIRLLKLTHG